MLEIEEAESSSARLETSPSAEFDRHFIVEGIGSMAKMVSRYGIDPETVDNVRIPAGLRLTDKTIAEKLSGIEIYDEELKRIDFTPDNNGVIKDNELIKAAVVTYAKTQSLIEATSDTKTRTRLQKFGDSILDKTSQIIAGTFGKKGMRLFASGVTIAMLVACSPNGIVPVAPIVVNEGGNGRLTQSAPLPTVQRSVTENTATPTSPAKSTETPTPAKPTEPPTAEPSPTKEEQIDVHFCNAENFLNAENYVDPKTLDNTYYDALVATLTEPFDPAKVKRVPFYNAGDNVTYALVTPPNYQKLTVPNFNKNLPEAWPFQRFITGWTKSYDGTIYAVMPIKFFNPNGKDQIVMTLHKFDKSTTDAEKIATIKLWEDHMHVTPIEYPYNKPDDPFVSASLIKYPDWQLRFRAFTANNTYNFARQDMTALGRMILLNEIILSPNHWYE